MGFNGIYGDLMVIYGDLMVISGELMVIYMGIYRGYNGI